VAIVGDLLAVGNRVGFFEGDKDDGVGLCVISTVGSTVRNEGCALVEGRSVGEGCSNDLSGIRGVRNKEGASVLLRARTWWRNASRTSILATEKSIMVKMMLRNCVGCDGSG